MKAIINDKLYDTDKALEIYSYARVRVIPPRFYLAPGTGIPEQHYITIYQSFKGAFFETDEHGHNDVQIKPLELSEVREVIARLDPDKYIELFGEVEEA